MDSVKAWLTVASAILTCALGLVVGVIFADRWPWPSWVIVNLCVVAVLLAFGGALLAFLHGWGWAQKHLTIMQVLPVAVGVLSMACFPLSLLRMAPWELDDPTSAQALQNTTNRQIIRLANDLAAKLKDREQINDSAREQIVDPEYSALPFETPAERIRNFASFSAAQRRLSLQQVAYFRQHYKAPYDALASELRQRTGIAESDEDRFNIRAEEDLSGSFPLSDLADDLLKHANALPPDQPD